MSKEIINDSTGEVVEEKQEVKFASMWSNPYDIKGQDLSNEIEDVFEEIAPFAIDASTGEFLNKSSVPVVKQTGKVNVWEKIQSFSREVDLYHILEKFAYSGDQALINARECQYINIADLPDNLNDYAKLVNLHLDKLSELNPELAKMVIDEKYSPDDIEAKAKEIMQSRIDANKKESEENK